MQHLQQRGLNLLAAEFHHDDHMWDGPVVLTATRNLQRQVTGSGERIPALSTLERTSHFDVVAARGPDLVTADPAQELWRDLTGEVALWEPSFCPRFQDHRDGLSVGGNALVGLSVFQIGRRRAQVAAVDIHVC